MLSIGIDIGTTDGTLLVIVMLTLPSLSNRRRRPPAQQIPHAPAHRGRHLRRRRAARPGAHRGAQRGIVPQGRGARRHLHQGLVRGLDGAPRDGLRERGAVSEGAQVQAARAGHAGAV